MSSYAKIDKWNALDGSTFNNVVQVTQAVLTNGDYTASFSGGATQVDYAVNQYSYPYGIAGATSYEQNAGGLSPTGWWIVPDFCARIKPLYNTSKIVVMLELIYGCSYWEGQGRIIRNGMPIGLGRNRGDRQPVTFADNNYEYTSSAQYSQYSTYKASVCLVDDPFGQSSSDGYATTSNAGMAVNGWFEYYVELNHHASQSICVNRPWYNNNDSSYYSEPISTLTLMEVTQ
jgi:hypothetical protein